MTEILYDFSAPMCSAAIITPDGVRWPLWMNIKERQDVLAAYSKANLGGLAALAFLSSIEVSLDLAGIPKITLELSPPLEEGQKLLDSSLLEYPYSILEVELGWRGVTPSVYSGRLQAPSFRIVNDISITLTAVGEGGFDTATSPRGDILPPMTRREAIEYLLKGSRQNRNLTLDVSEIQPNTKAAKALDEQVVISMGGYTEWFTIQSLARQARCWTLFLGSSLLLRPHQEKLTGDPVRNFITKNFPGGILGPKSKNFPILELDAPESDALYFTGVTKGLYQGDIQSATGEVLERFINDDTEQLSRNGPGTPVKDPYATPGVGTPPYASAIAPGSPDEPQQYADATALYEDISTKGIGFPLNITSMGCPDLFPGDIIGVFGVGRRFDTGLGGRRGTTYGVYEMTHRYAVGEMFTTAMKVNSNIAPFAEKAAILEPDAAGPVSMYKADPEPKKGGGGQRNQIVPIVGSLPGPKIKFPGGR